MTDYKESTKDKLKRVTHWGIASETLQSEYGKISFEDWLGKEIVRIGNRCKVRIIKRHDGLIALSR